MNASESVSRVAHVVFTRVEPEYSPKTREGYQVVWASPWLPPAVVSEIELRVCCYSPLPGRGPRLQFSALRSSGYFAARSEQIEVNRRLCDRAGRPVFLAQAGWFGDEILERSEFTPFVVLDALAGIRTVEDLVDRFGQATGVATDLEVDVSGGLPGRLGEDATERSVALALTGEILSKSHPFSTPCYFLNGESGQVESVLRMLCTALPPVLRKICSFDTEIDGCFSRDKNYLFLSGLRLPPAVQLTLIDLAIPRTPAIADEVCNVYLAWLHRALSSDSESVIARTGTAYHVSRALCGYKSAPKSELLDRDTCREILQHESERLRRRMAAIRRRRFRRQSYGVDFKSALSEQVQTVPEAVIAALAKSGDHGMWSLRSLFGNLWHLLRSD